MKEIVVDNSREAVYERSDYPLEKIRSILKEETVAVLGYGVQGRGQSLNMRDNGIPVIIGLRKGGRSWDLAISDGWVPGKTLLSYEEAAEKARSSSTFFPMRAKKNSGQRSSLI